jgi:hypothetical protein
MRFGSETRGLRSVHWILGAVLTLGACGSDSVGGTQNAGGTAATPDAAAGGGGVQVDATPSGGTPVTPDAAVVTPDAAAVTPDAAVVTPDAAVPTPDAAVVTPDAAVVSPDAAVVPPEPDATVVPPDPDFALPPPEPDAALPEPDAALLARVITVCPDGSCDFRTPGEAARATEGGEIVEIQAGDYVDCATWPVSVTIRGVGGRPVVRDVACGGKAIWITQGAETTIENIEFTGMAVPDRNGAGVRHEGGRLVLRDVYMHDGEQGVLADANDRASVIIEDSLFERLGQDGLAHGVYANQIAELVIRGSQFLASQNEGHEIKSRALRTLIECSVIASLDGVDSRNIDLPNGGDVEIRGSVIQQGANSANREIIGYGLENAPNPIQRFVMTDTLILNDAGDGTFVHIAGDPMVEVHDDLFVGGGAVQLGGDPFAVNVSFRSREAAALPAEPELPAPSCVP